MTVSGRPAARKFGFRFDRHADMDLFTSTDDPERDELLRSLVDCLPADEQLVLSRLFFGADSPSLQHLSRELGISIDKLKARRDSGFAFIRSVLTSD